MQSAPGPRELKFGPFAVDLQVGELRKNGTRIRLQEKPLRVLALLAERQGELVTREELKKHLWAEETFVDFETGLNTAVKKLRGALSDEAEHPRYIETIPRRGYRFLMPVEIEQNLADASSSSSMIKTNRGVIESNPVPLAVDTAHADTTKEAVQKLRGSSWRWAALGTLAAGLVLLAVWFGYGHSILSFQPKEYILISDFENHTGDPQLDQALQTAFAISMEQSRYANVYPRTQLPSVLRRMGRPENEKITTALAMEICQRERIRGLLQPGIGQVGQQFILTAQLINPTNGAVVRSYEITTSNEDHLIEAMDRITREVRGDLGESIYQIHWVGQPLARVTTSSLEALKDYSAAEQLWHAAKYNPALASYKAALAIDPDFTMANAAVAHAYCSFVYHLSAECQKYYEKALANSSRTTDRERQIIQAHFAEDMGHDSEAMELHERYLDQYPDDLIMRYGYARLLRMSSRQEEAIAQEKQILRLSPNDARTFVDLATAYHSLDELGQSLEAYHTAFELDPYLLEVSNINREYGFTLAQSGQVAQAEQLFAGLLENPNQYTKESGLRSLGILDLYRGRFRSAQEHLEAALKIDMNGKNIFPVARNRYFLSVAAAGEDRRKEQIAQLDLIGAALAAMDPKIQYGSILGKAYIKAGELEKAEKILSQIAPLEDNGALEKAAYLRVLKAEIAAAKGDTTGALQLLEPPWSGIQSDTEFVVIDSLARIHRLAGNADQAIAWYEKLLKSPTSSIGWEPQQDWFEDHLILAQLYVQQGQPGKALHVIETLLSYWKDADANLPLKIKAIQMRSSLLGQH